MSGIDQARSTARFISGDRIDGTFAAGGNSFAVTVRDVSVNGAQIEHPNPLRPMLQGKLSAGKLNVRATVVWTRMSVPGVYRSGLRLDEALDVVAAGIRQMLADGVIRKGEDTLRERERARREREEARQRLLGLKPVPARIAGETEKTIRRAREWFLAHPEEALKWYQRAKATATEEMLQIAASGRLNREDVLAVWEYLDRRFDLRDVVRALN